MKRTWMIVGALMVALFGLVAVAEARGPGYGVGNGAGGPGIMMGGGGRGMMGGGPGMMGGGPGQRGSFATCAESYDPAAILANHQEMLAQHEALLVSLEEQLANTEDERRIALLERNIERQRLMIAYQNGKLPVIEGLPETWLEGAIDLATYDIEFFSTAASDDSWIQAWITNRLTRAQERLAYLEGQIEQ